MQTVSKTNTLVKLGMLAALGVVLIIVTRFPLFTDYLKYDAGDIASMVAATVFGPIYGLAVVCVTAAIQALAIDPQSGWIGLLGHLVATGSFILVSSLIYRKFKTLLSLVIGLALGVISAALVMIPVNYFILLPLYGVPANFIPDTIIYAITPFNLVKFSINSVLSFIVYKTAGNYLAKESLLFKNRKKNLTPKA